MRNYVDELQPQVFLPLKYLHELKNAPEHKLSLKLFSELLFLQDYTGTGKQTDEAAHVMRTDLPRNLRECLTHLTHPREVNLLTTQVRHSLSHIGSRDRSRGDKGLPTQPRMGLCRPVSAGLVCRCPCGSARRGRARALPKRRMAESLHWHHSHIHGGRPRPAELLAAMGTLGSSLCLRAGETGTGSSAACCRAVGPNRRSTSNRCCCPGIRRRKGWRGTAGVHRCRPVAAGPLPIKKEETPV